MLVATGPSLCFLEWEARVCWGWVVVICAVSPKPPLPRPPTSCLKSLLTSRSSHCVYTRLPFSPVSVSAPSLTGGLAALRAGVAIDKQ